LSQSPGKHGEGAHIRQEDAGHVFRGGQDSELQQICSHYICKTHLGLLKPLYLHVLPVEDVFVNNSENNEQRDPARTTALF